MVMIVCEHCGKRADKMPGAVNRARKIGASLFCGRRCAGLAHRKHKTKAQRVEEKRLYDAEYRRRNLAMLKAKKADYFRRTYDPDKARFERKKTMARHVEYCRQPKYKAYKREYDANRYAQQAYGPFAEVHKARMALDREIKQRITDYEKRQQNQINCKAQARERADQTQRNQPRQGRGSHRSRRATAYG